MSVSSSIGVDGAPQNKSFDAPANAGRKSIRQFKKIFGNNLRNLTFLMMLSVSALPILGFYKWVERSSYEQEISHVRENHLIIAQNLSAALTRYATDMKVMFAIAVKNHSDQPVVTELKSALAKFHLCHVLILTADNQVLTHIDGADGHNISMPSSENLAHLRDIAERANGEMVVSGIRSHNGAPHYFVAQALEDGQLAVAPWSPKYVIELQKSIAFGERGHSMIVDHLGRVVAHPNPKWQASSKDAGKLPVVQAMIAGKTGVMQFYSPPMKAQMIAGYTFVPETGWGVMVPQPLSELADRAAIVQNAALLVALFEIMFAVVITFVLAGLLTKPIQAIAESARELSEGDLTSRIGKVSRYTPREIVVLTNSFNDMAHQLQRKTENLQNTLAESEANSREKENLLIEANRANAVKSQFVAMVSHELKTPLTSIMGSLDLMNSGLLGDFSDKVTNLISIACKNSARLSKMIDDLLDLEKLDSGKMRFRFKNADLSTLVSESLDANRPIENLSQVKFTFSKPKRPVQVKCDPDRLQQVMANLLSNAAKFSHPEGEVNIRLDVQGDKARVSVTDRGVGIPPEMESKVFERFVQLDSSDHRNAGGNGLGLSIAKQIVDEHGGSLAYESEVGSGTVFFFDLPILNPKESGDEEA